jgi:hypothetical protein
MASLYVASNNARKIGVVILVVVTIFLLADTFIRFSDVSKQTNTTRRFYLDPDLALGSFTAHEIPGINFDRSVPIVQESIHPVFPDVSYVYKIEQPREKLGTFENASKTATTLGFTAKGAKDLGSNNFQWISDDNTKVLNFNRVNQTWSLTTQYENNVDAIKAKKIGSNIASYNARAKNIVTALGFSTGIGMDNAFIDSRYVIRGNQGDIFETQKSTDANYVIMDVFRQLPQSALKLPSDQPSLLPSETKPQETIGIVYTSDPRKGEVHLVVSNDVTSFAKDIFEMKFTNFEYSTKGNYYVTTPEEAFTRLQRGQGSLVAIQPEGEDYFTPYIEESVSRIIIDARRTEMGFYEPETWTGLTYPIYILKGRAELTDGKLAKVTFFVDAIKRQT